jgi:hypothetical protein
MAYDDHPMIQEAKSLVLDGDAFYTKDQIVTRFSRLNPDERVHFIRGQRAAMTADDGTTLRQRSQLLSLNRELESMHRRLLAADR